jgi:hypothetical protein
MLLAWKWDGSRVGVNPHPSTAAIDRRVGPALSELWS